MVRPLSRLFYSAIRSRRCWSFGDTQVNPAYPEQAKREGIEGSIKLTIIINEEGFVYEAKGNPGNNPVLEKAAIPAVKRWRFSPFLLKNVPVAIETTAMVYFDLKWIPEGPHECVNSDSDGLCPLSWNGWKDRSDGHRRENCPAWYKIFQLR